MITQFTDSSVSIISFFNVALVSFVDVIMEGVFEGDSVVLIGSLNFNDESTDNRFVSSP